MRISQILQRSAQLYPKSPFLCISCCGENDVITYHDSYRISLSYRGWIQDRITKELEKRTYDKYHNVQVIVAFYSQNSPGLILSIVGGIDLGAYFQLENKKVNVTCAMVNIRWSAKEVSTALKVRNGNDDTMHLTILLYSKELKVVSSEACSFINSDDTQQLCNHYAISHSLPSIDEISYKNISLGLKLHDPEHEILEDTSKANDDAILLFTSGTTSGPKGVRLSHVSLLVQAIVKTTPPCSYDSSTKLLATAVPFFHVGGISSALAIIMSGAMLIFPIPSSNATLRFDPALVLNSMDRREQPHLMFGVNTLVVVPAMLHAIFDEIETQCFQSNPIYYGVRLILVGGQNITLPQKTKSATFFPNARIVQTYACTEAGSSITFATNIDSKSVSSCTSGNDSLSNVGTCVGYPPHHVEVKIFKLDGENKPTKRFAQPFDVGAIGTRGPHVMSGYWQRGEVSDSTLQKNKWLVTNDLGYLDTHGRLFFCGRFDDVIRSGGESVFAPEVEKVIIKHAEIDQCAVFKLPNKKFGEIVCAAVVLKRNQNDGCWLHSISVSNQFTISIRSFCKECRLTGYKLPKVVFVCNEFPCNSSGKVLKQDLARACGKVWYANDMRSSKL